MDQIYYSPRQIRRGMSCSIWAAVLWSFYASFIVGPVMAGLEVALNFTPSQIALINSMAQIFLPLQLVGLIIQTRYFHRTKFWGTLATAQFVLFGCLGVFAHFYGNFTPAIGFLLFAITYAISTICSSLIAPIGLIWHADFVPKRASNAFWSKRNGTYMLFNMFAGIVSGVLIDKLGQSSSSSYTIMLLLGMIFGFMSVALQVRIPDPNPYPKKDNENPLKLFSAALAHKDFRNIIMIFSCQAAGISFSFTFANVYLISVIGMNMKTLQILIAVSSAFSFLCSYFFRIAGTKYGRKPILLMCTVLKALEFALWASIMPNNHLLDNFGNQAVQSLAGICGFTPFELPVGMLTVLPIYLLSGFTSIGIASSQQSLITSQSDRKVQGAAIAVMFSLVGVCGATAGLLSGKAYEFLSSIPHLLGEFHPFNILAMVSALVCLLTIFLIARIKEDGAVKTTQMMRVLLTENPIRQVYQSYIMARPLSENSRLDKLQNLRGSMVSQELIADLYSPSSRVRDEAIAHLNQISGKVDSVVIEELIKLTQIPELGLRVQAMRALGRLKAQEARSLAEEMAVNSEPAMAQAAVYVLGLLGNVESRSTLVRILENSDEFYYLQASASEALSRVGDATDAPTIIKAYQGEDNPILAKQILLSLCRLWFVGGKTQAYVAFDREQKESGKEIENLLKSYADSRFWSSNKLSSPKLEELLSIFDSGKNGELSAQLIASIAKQEYPNISSENLTTILPNGVVKSNANEFRKVQLQVLVALHQSLGSEDEDLERAKLFTIMVGCEFMQKKKQS